MAVDDVRTKGSNSDHGFVSSRIEFADNIKHVAEVGKEMLTHFCVFEICMAIFHTISVANLSLFK